MNNQGRYPLNSVGDFYVENDLCICCTAPEHEAPDLMAHDPKAPGGYHCYFKRQPSTPEELQRAVMAVRAGCCGAVRYGGQDRTIIERLGNDPDTCDYIADSRSAELQRQRNKRNKKWWQFWR